MQRLSPAAAGLVVQQVNVSTAILLEQTIHLYKCILYTRPATCSDVCLHWFNLFVTAWSLVYWYRGSQDLEFILDKLLREKPINFIGYLYDDWQEFDLELEVLAVAAGQPSMMTSIRVANNFYKYMTVFYRKPLPLN